MSRSWNRGARRAGMEETSRLFRLRRGERDILLIPIRTVAPERSLQTLIERHLTEFLDARLVASEYPIGTGPEGRIDTLGLDRHGAPVVVEYKRRGSGNLISQGLFYLDWLDEHKAEFRHLVYEHLGPAAAAEVRWATTRLICVAADFHYYDLRAVRQTKWRIELLRYCWFGDDLLHISKVGPCGW